MAYFIAKDVRIFGEKPKLHNPILDFMIQKLALKIEVVTYIDNVKNQCLATEFVLK